MDQGVWWGGAVCSCAWSRAGGQSLERAGEELRGVGGLARLERRLFLGDKQVILHTMKTFSYIMCFEVIESSLIR